MGSGWAGLGRADLDTWHAVMLPRHGRGLLLGFVHSASHTVWLMVHGPTAGCMVDRVHRLFSLAWLMCTELMLGCQGEGGVPLFFLWQRSY